MDNNTQAFLALVRGGLWETVVRLSKFEPIDYSRVLSLAIEQSVVGLVAAGLEHVVDVKVPKEDVLQFVGQTLQLEQRNLEMNRFIGVLVEKMREGGIYTLLVKGQGIALCYEKPLWRVLGDVDLYLSKDNYEKAKNFLIPLAQHLEVEDKRRLHYGMNIENWVVELHGSMHEALSRKMNRLSDDVYNDLFYRGNIRSWDNDGVQVFLPSADNDVIIIFNHFIGHFYGEGIGLRQVCDWCRLLWTFREKIDIALLEKRLKRTGLMSEWKGFAALAVEYLGMPVESMPLFDEQFKDKGSKLIEFILKGHSGNKVKETWRVVKIFPWKTLSYLPSIFLNVNWLKIKERLFGND